jgi:hypothetical protein
MASWQLPRPDFHRLADDSFAGHTSDLLGGIQEANRSSSIVRILIGLTVNLIEASDLKNLPPRHEFIDL